MSSSRVNFVPLAIYIGSRIVLNRAHVTCTQVDNLKAEVERQRKMASDAHAARVDSDKALASAHANMSASRMSMQAKMEELEQSR